MFYFRNNKIVYDISQIKYVQKYMKLLPSGIPKGLSLTNFHANHNII